MIAKPSGRKHTPCAWQVVENHPNLIIVMGWNFKSLFLFIEIARSHNYPPGKYSERCLFIGFLHYLMKQTRLPLIKPLGMK